MVITVPATDIAKQWDGWGTALKPAHEPIIVVRKPLIGTVVGNVERYGTGAVECGFMTNRQEAELLKSDVYRRKCALAIVTGIVETYGLKRKRRCRAAI
jgi:hypothetical protein